MLGLGSLIGQLWQDALALVHAEVELVKSKAFARIRWARTAVILLLAAACVAFASLVALMLGFVLALVPVVGAALAGLIVLAGGLLIAGLLTWMAIRSLAEPLATPQAEKTA